MPEAFAEMKTLCYNVLDKGNVPWQKVRTLVHGKENTMRIAVTYDNDGQVFQHFGHTEQFKIYEFGDSGLENTMVIRPNGEGHEAMAGFLAKGNVKVLICGGIGEGAMNALSGEGILVVPGAKGDADLAVASFLRGILQTDMTPNCDHHGAGHTCGGGCGGCGGCH